MELDLEIGWTKRAFFAAAPAEREAVVNTMKALVAARVDAPRGTCAAHVGRKGDGWTS